MRPSSLTLLALAALPAVFAEGPAAACGKACFPSLAFETPDVASGKAPNVSLSSWWCTRSSEYGFMGFSYDIDGCPDYNTMLGHFQHQRRGFGARYVRLYAACDIVGHTDDVVRAAYNSGLGVFALVWWGFDNNDMYKTRLAAWLNTISKNALAPYVVRNIAIGSEPLYDGATTWQNLASLIDSTRASVSSKGIQVTTSEMAYGYVKRNATALFAHEDHIEANLLPFFSKTATIGSNAWPDVQVDIDYFLQQTASKKKIFLTQTGWPSTAEVWKPNNDDADPSLASEQQYYELLSSRCSYFKTLPGGGLGWFAHIYADNTLPGWGVVNSTKIRTPKITFGGRTAC